MATRGRTWFVASMLFAILPLVAAVPGGLASGEPKAAASSTILSLECQPREALYMMEYSHIGDDTCWAKLGHHHYFVGQHRAFTLLGGSGHLVAVDQHEAPPTDLQAPQPSAPLRVHSLIQIESSLDGITWQDVGDISYELVGTFDDDQLGEDFWLWEDRQTLQFAFGAHPEPFRFIRLRAPMAATQGLSGAIDHSAIRLQVDPLPLDPAPVFGPSEERSFDCERHILEDIFETHPCWFGAAWPEQAPSWFHTYPVGPARVDAIAARVTPVVYRPMANPFISVYLQTSADGLTWDRVARASTIGGQPLTIGATGLADKEVRFVRLAAPMISYYGSTAHRPMAYLMESSIEVTGAFST